MPEKTKSGKRLEVPAHRGDALCPGFQRKGNTNPPHAEVLFARKASKHAVRLNPPSSLPRNKSGVTPQDEGDMPLLPLEEGKTKTPLPVSLTNVRVRSIQTGSRQSHESPELHYQAWEAQHFSLAPLKGRGRAKRRVRGWWRVTHNPARPPYLDPLPQGGGEVCLSDHPSGHGEGGCAFGPADMARHQRHQFPGRQAPPLCARAFP